MASECFGVDDGGGGVMWRQSSIDGIGEMLRLDGVLGPMQEGYETSFRRYGRERC
jgi:hypothetical protein